MQGKGVARDEKGKITLYSKSNEDPVSFKKQSSSIIRSTFQKNKAVQHGLVKGILRAERYLFPFWEIKLNLILWWPELNLMIVYKGCVILIIRNILGFSPQFLAHSS